MVDTNLIGKRFGRLVVLSETKHKRRPAVICLCDCGTQKTLNRLNVTKGKTLSCGCYRDERIRETCGTIAHLHRAEYKVWSGIKRRCLNANDPSYRTYGAMGVTICDRWRDSFECFYEDMGNIPSLHTIDRIDNSKGYSPDNCRWATRRQQAQNTRKATTLTYLGVTKPTPDWAREFNLTLPCLHGRINAGWDIERALTTPRGKGRRRMQCPKGHAYDEANTYEWRGKRICKTCARDKLREHRAKQKLS